MKIKPVRETSLLAYEHALETLGERQLQVLLAIDKIGPCCDFDIAENLNKPINTITPRRNELEKLKLIKESHKGKSPTGRQAIFWKRIKK